MTGEIARDTELKLRLRRLLFSQGYWSPIEVELSHYENLGTSMKRQSLTDLDVLGVRYDQLFTCHRIVGDCKTGKHVSDTNRLFWLRGIMTYFGADQAYFLRPKINSQARAIAPKMNLRVLDERELTALEKAIGADVLKLPLADLPIQRDLSELWGIYVPKGEQPTGNQLALKAVYSYLSYYYWYIEPHRNLLTLVDKFETTAHLLNADEPRHVFLAFVGAERFAHCLLDIASHIQSQVLLMCPVTHVYTFMEAPLH